jgi:hypothetical protein
MRRKANRRHMIGDHHGRTAGRATLLVRAVDGILGTHMHISINTVKSHLKSIHRKLAATRRSDAVRRARELQLI